MTLNLHEIETARERIAPYIVKTPLLRLKNLDKHLGCEVYVKPECMQNTDKVCFFISGGSVSLEQIKMLDDVAS